MGVAGILGGHLLSAIHGVTVENTLYEDGDQQTRSKDSNRPRRRDLFDGYRERFWSQIFGTLLVIKVNSISLCYLFPLWGLLDPSIGIIGLAS